MWSILKKSFIDYYYFSIPVVIWLLSIPFAVSYILWSWSSFLGKKSENNVSSVYFILALFVFHFGLIHIYYPMNTGIEQNKQLSENDFIKNLPDNSRLLIIFNNESEVEKLYGSRISLDNALRMHQIPEYTRFQSNITLRGNYFNTLETSGIYTIGSNFIPGFLDQFHLTVLNNDDFMQQIFKGRKGYMRTGPKSAESSLFDVAGVTHIFSSLPLKNSRYKMIFKGDQYYIYQNNHAFEKVFLSEL